MPAVQDTLIVGFKLSGNLLREKLCVGLAQHFGFRLANIIQIGTVDQYFTPLPVLGVYGVGQVVNHRAQEQTLLRQSGFRVFALGDVDKRADRAARPAFFVEERHDVAQFVNDRAIVKD